MRESGDFKVVAIELERAVDLVRRRRRIVDLQSAHAAVGLQIQPAVIKSTARKPGGILSETHE